MPVDASEEAADNYLAVASFLNIVCVVLIPISFLFAHPRAISREIVFGCFTGFSLFCFILTIRDLYRVQRYRLVIFAAGSFVAMSIISWICIWPDIVREIFAFHLVAAFQAWVIFLFQYGNRALDRVLLYVLLIGVAIIYTLLFLPIMLAVASKKTNRDLADQGKTLASRTQLVAQLMVTRGKNRK